MGNDVPPCYCHHFSRKISHVLAPLVNEVLISNEIIPIRHVVGEGGVPVLCNDTASPRSAFAGVRPVREEMKSLDAIGSELAHQAQGQLGEGVEQTIIRPSPLRKLRIQLKSIIELGLLLSQNFYRLVFELKANKVSKFHALLFSLLSVA